MIGRGALGNPWMLYRTVHYLTTGELLPDPTPSEKMRIAILHMDRLVSLKGRDSRGKRDAQASGLVSKGLRKLHVLKT